MFSDAFSEEKRRTMQAFGARITDVPSDRKKITEGLIKAMISTAAEISLRPGHWYCDQLNNRASLKQNANQRIMVGLCFCGKFWGTGGYL